MLSWRRLSGGGTGRIAAATGGVEADGAREHQRGCSGGHPRAAEAAEAVTEARRETRTVARHVGLHESRVQIGERLVDARIGCQVDVADGRGLSQKAQRAGVPRFHPFPCPFRAAPVR
ncbi:hypothetical protein ACFVH6_08635 [Spirillospora sp. NPDC127200]